MDVTARRCPVPVQDNVRYSSQISKFLYSPKRTKFRVSDLIYCLVSTHILQHQHHSLLLQIPWKRKTKPRHRVPSYRYKSDRHNRPDLSLSRVKLNSELAMECTDIDPDEIEISMDAGDARPSKTEKRQKIKRRKFIPSAEHCG